MSYTALVLDPLSQIALADRLGVSAGWEQKCHHMTLHMGAHDADRDPPLGSRFEVLAHRAGGNGLVTAVRVKTDLKTCNYFPHITVAVNKAEGGKPVMSNHVKSWHNITPLELTGTVQECA